MSAAFEQLEMAGLLDERRGRRGPVKLHPEVVAFIRAETNGSGAEIADRVADRFEVWLHRGPSRRSADGERHVALAAGRGGRRSTTSRCVITCSSRGSCRTGSPLPGSPGRVWQGLIAWPVAEPVFLVEITGAERQRWHPHLDAGEDDLAACYQFLLDAATGATGLLRAGCSDEGGAVRGCPPSGRPSAARSARNWNSCTAALLPPDRSWSVSTSTTGTPVPGWTGLGSTHCARAIYEPEATVVRRIFADRASGLTVSGWHVQFRLRIPLDPPGPGKTP